MFKIQNALSVGGWFQQYSAGAVAKEHTGGAILIIQNGSHGVAADCQNLFVRAGGNKLRANSEGVRKSRAGRGEIKSPGFFCADAVLYQAGGGREKHVRSNAGHDD